MGYNISTIENLPALSGYYFFLVGKESSAVGRSDAALYRRFDEIAERIGVNSGIVKSGDQKQINEELMKAFKRAPWFREVYDEFLYREPMLLILKPHPKKFRFRENDFFALIPFETLDKVYPSERELIRDIVELAVDGKLDLIEKVSESNERANILKRIKRACILQPNVNGIGIDLKELRGSKETKSFVFRGEK